MLEPLLEHLSCLSSADFYQELAAWKDTVEIGLSRSKPTDTTDNNGGNDGNDERDMDSFSSIDPSDVMETVRLMDELEDGIPTMEGCTDSGNASGSEDDILPTQKHGETKLHDETSAFAPSSSKAESSQNAEGVGKCSSNELATKPGKLISTSRQVDIVNMPKPKRGNVRVTKKQLRQTKLATGPARIAVHKYPSGLTVNLEQLLTWARNTPNLKFVLEMLDKYPVQFEDAYLRGRSIDCQWEAMKSTDYMHTFVIPVDLTRSLQAAIKTARKEQHAPDELDARLKKQGVVLDLVATVDPKLWKMRR
ncbi:hypothetical protein AM587_10001081 [Phytophthora nicotianae]|nr:hypothetical protein AM587_10002128 [Phytophthora nicotianae]KUG01858.1 hypothetical protein AM587_10001081 [Phytophthora nicotianae]